VGDRSHLVQALSDVGQSRQELRENDWLMGIKQRTSIPGGLCEFDVPSYHFWLHQAPNSTARSRAMARAFPAIRDGIAIVLRLPCAKVEEYRSRVAVQGRLA
jgi:cell division protein ZapD